MAGFEQIMNASDYYMVLQLLKWLGLEVVLGVTTVTVYVQGNRTTEASK